METIWKFDVPIGDEISVKMPKGAKLLSVQAQHDMPCVWALVDSSDKIGTRKFAWRGTGHLSAALTREMYVGTIQLHGGSLIFHLFDRGFK